MSVNLGHVGYLIGLLHDMGKAAKPVQRRLSGSPEKYPHAYAGARYLVERLEAMEKAGPINPYMYLLVEERLKEVFMDSLVGVADCKLVWE